MLHLAAAVLACVPAQTVPYSHGDPTNDEQYVLEIINRARANPTAEGTRLGIDITQNYPTTDPPLSPVGPRPPLAMNAQLLAAARAHSQDMWTRAFFDHVNPDTLGPGERITNAGYSWTKCGENISTGSNHSAAQLEDNLMIDDQVVGRGHRVNLLDIWDPPYYREIGVGYYHNDTPVVINIGGTDYSLRDFLTENFGLSSAGPFLVGVVYDDANANGFYDPGEGIPNVTVQPSSGTYHAVTSTSGGYAIPMAGVTGPIQVQFTGGGITPLTTIATVGTDNVKLDYNTGSPPVSSDDDNDGMPNTWETQYGLNPNDPADAAQDLDNDTYTNLQEYQAGTDPTNPADYPGSGGGGGTYTGGGYYDPVTGVYVGIPSSSGQGGTGEGENGDDGVNDSCLGSAAAGSCPWIPLAIALLLGWVARRKTA